MSYPRWARGWEGVPPLPLYPSPYRHLSHPSRPPPTLRVTHSPPFPHLTPTPSNPPTCLCLRSGETALGQAGRDREAKAAASGGAGGGELYAGAAEGNSPTVTSMTNASAGAAGAGAAAAGAAGAAADVVDRKGATVRILGRVNERWCGATYDHITGYVLPRGGKKNERLPRAVQRGAD